jgi:hypothetical protein
VVERLVHTLLKSWPFPVGYSPLLPAALLPQGARENLPGPGLDGKLLLQPRTMTDRAARAAALQPISASRAELLGVQVRVRGCKGVKGLCEGRWEA